ncbi:MAG: biotin/lipoyl-containing protein [Bacteroidota bacterium]
MLSVKVNNKKEYQINLDDGQQLKGTVDGKFFDCDITEIKKGIFYIINNHKSYTAELIKKNHTEKSLNIRINGNTYFVQIKDKFDELLKKTEMGNASVAKIKEVKAPMPGLVIDVRVKEGDAIKKGDTIVILEAMKMENILKSPIDVTIKKIHVQKGDTINKDQVLVNFE